MPAWLVKELEETMRLLFEPEPVLLCAYSQNKERFAQQWARYQARPQRTYSMAARLRQSLRPLKAKIRKTLRL